MSVLLAPSPNLPGSADVLDLWLLKVAMAKRRFRPNDLVRTSAHLQIARVILGKRKLMKQFRCWKDMHPFTKYFGVFTAFKSAVPAMLLHFTTPNA
jgi:hypothetical protein